MNNLLSVSSSPHIRSNDSTENIMRDVVIALLPATFFGIYNFGLRALLVTVITVLASMGAEALYQYLTKQPITLFDYSAAVTGLLLALNLPHTVPYWIPVLGSVFAIIIVKQLFGGLGQNVINPALAARAFLTISYATYMTNWKLDDVTTATPLAVLKSGGEAVALTKLLWGNVAGCIGETSAIALLLGGVYLLARRVINWRIPVIYIVTVFVLTGLLGGRGFDIEYMLYHVLGGGLLIGAFFMATDYVSSPVTPVGQIIFALAIGILTVIIRLFGPNAEGVSFAILFMNLWVPIIERFTVPKAFGEERSNAR